MHRNNVLWTPRTTKIGFGGIRGGGDGYYGEGREEGIGIGLEKGVEIGMEKGIYETAKNAIGEGGPNEVIKKITKLTDGQIEAVRKELER